MFKKNTNSNMQFEIPKSVEASDLIFFAEIYVHELDL